MLVGHCDVHLLAHGDDVLVPDPTEGLGVLLEGEVGGAPLLEQGGKHVRRLATDDKQPRVELPQARVQVLEALEKEPAISMSEKSCMTTHRSFACILDV